MSNLQMVMSGTVNNTTVDGYYGDEQAWFTREQIGTALGYSQPRVAITKIHKRHPERLNLYSVVTSLVSTDGKGYETYLYNFKGILEICRWSRQPKANEIMDKLYDMAEAVVKKGYFSVLTDAVLIEHLKQRLTDNPHLISDVNMNRHQMESYNTFALESQYRDLWAKRYNLSSQEYIDELVRLNDRDVRRSNRELRKYICFAKAHAKMSEEVND